MFGALIAAEDHAVQVLDAVAREFSPRVTVEGPVPTRSREVTLDLSGLSRLFGDGRTLAHELRRTAAERGVRVRVAVASTRTAARLLAHARPGLSVLEPECQAATLAALPLSALAPVIDGDVLAPEVTPPWLELLRRWGLRTLGEFAALPGGEVAARLGQEGVRWQRLARGEDVAPFVPMGPEEVFEQAMELEWPIEGTEPLSFVLARLLEPLCQHLERRDRAAAALHVRLQLVSRVWHERTLTLPTPMREAKALRTLALLDLEANPPAAAIDRVVVRVDPTPARVLQFSLLTRPLPSPVQLSTLLARLGALMGDDRCGAPAEVDSWEPGACGMRPFAPVEQPALLPSLPSRVAPEAGTAPEAAVAAVTAVRRFRVPVPARVRVERGMPVRVVTDRRGWAGGTVEASAGPWRTSGGWWQAPGDGRWDRDEWDVTLADGVTYRAFRDRFGEAWYLEGVVD